MLNWQGSGLQTHQVIHCGLMKADQGKRVDELVSEARAKLTYPQSNTKNKPQARLNPGDEKDDLLTNEYSMNRRKSFSIANKNTIMMHMHGTCTRTYIACRKVCT